AALVIVWPSWLTRPASTSARAAAREGARPCVTSSWSTRSSPWRSTGSLRSAAWRGRPWRAWKEFMLIGTASARRSVAVRVGLVRTCLRHADVGRLRVGQLGELHVELPELQAGDLLVEVLGQRVDAHRVVGGAGEQLDLRDGLVGEGARHHVARVAGGAAEVNQAALGEQDDALAVRENDVVHLGLDLFPLVAFDAGDVDLVVEVADVAHDGLVLHLRH